MCNGDLSPIINTMMCRTGRANQSAIGYFSSTEDNFSLRLGPEKSRCAEVTCTIASLP